jgi:hypothetical protein
MIFRCGHNIEMGFQLRTIVGANCYKFDGDYLAEDFFNTISALPSLDVIKVKVCCGSIG